jgi:hypothetical protein
MSLNSSNPINTLFKTMSLNLNLDDFSFDFIDAMAYEFYMETIVPLLEQEFSNPDATDEDITAISEKIIAMAKLSYHVASTFSVVRDEAKSLETKRSSD